jgi:hypothetical protein
VDDGICIAKKFSVLVDIGIGKIDLLDLVDQSLLRLVRQIQENEVIAFTKHR